MFIFIVIIASVEVAHIVCHRTFLKKKIIVLKVTQPVLHFITVCLQVLKPSEAPEKAACNLLNCLQLCHSVVRLHCGSCRLKGFEKEETCVE